MTREEAEQLYWSFLSSRSLAWGEAKPEITGSDLDDLAEWADMGGGGFVTDLYYSDAAIIAKWVVEVLRREGAKA